MPEENIANAIFGGGKPTTIQLTDAKNETPSLLEALETFQYIGKDVRDELDQVIPYGTVLSRPSTWRGTTPLTNG